VGQRVTWNLRDELERIVRSAVVRSYKDLPFRGTLGLAAEPLNADPRVGFRRRLFFWTRQFLAFFQPFPERLGEGNGAAVAADGAER
jgi:hypothetical protein